jgi:hypothetical protein
MSGSVSYHTAGRAGAGSCCTPPPLARSRHRPAAEPARRTAPTSSAPDRPRRPEWPSRLHGDGAEQDRSRARSVGSVDDERPPDRWQPECGSTTAAIPDAVTYELDGDHGVFLTAPDRFLTALRATCQLVNAPPHVAADSPARSASAS